MADPTARDRPSRHLLLHPRRRNSGGDGLLLPGHARRRRWGSSANRAAASRRSRSRIMRDLPGVGRITERRDPLRGPRHGEPHRTRSSARIRGSKIAMVYQEPMASLNPTMLVGRQLMEVPLIHDRVSQRGGPQPAPSTWSRPCACPIPSASCAPIRISSAAASSSASSSRWRCSRTRSCSSSTSRRPRSTSRSRRASSRSSRTSPPAPAPRRCSSPTISASSSRPATK